MAIKLYKSQINVSKQSSTVETAKLSPNFGQQAFQAQQNFLDLTQQIENKYQKIQEDKDVLQTTTEYNENLNEIIDNTNKLNNLEEGMLSYDTASDELYNNLTGKIKNQNVKRRVDAHITTVNSNYRIDVGSNIRKNSLQVFEAGLELHKNSTFNKMFTGNPALKTQLENQIFNGTPDEPSLYDQYTEAGILTPGITRETFNQSLKNEYLTSEAQFLVKSDLNKFYAKDKSGEYNNLDFKTLSDIRSSANTAKVSNNNSYLSGIKKEANVIKDQINSVVSFAEKNAEPDAEQVNYLKQRSIEINDILVANGEVGIGNNIDKLNNAMFIFENMSSIKKLPLSGVQAKLNELLTQQKKLENEGKPNMSLILLGEEIQKHIDFREANQKGDLLKVGTSIGLSDDGVPFTIKPIDFTNIDIEAIQTRKFDAERIANQLNIPTAEYFFKSERNQFKNIIETGSEDEIKNAILTITEMAGEKSYLAFGEMSDASNAISQLGILFKHTGFNIDPAIRAFALRGDESTQKILSQYNTASNVSLAAVKENNLQVYKMSPAFNNVKHYKMMSAATDIIFQGMILNDPEYNKMFDTDDVPTGDAAEVMKGAVNIAVGFDGQYGGLEEYNGHMIIVPSRFPDADGNLTVVGHKNAEIGRGEDTLEELLESEKMTNALLARAVSSAPVLPQGLEIKKTKAKAFELETEYQPAPATVKDLFNQKRVHLVAKGHGQYIFVFGDDPRTSDAKLRDADGQVVTFDLSKIYSELVR
tara:strand:- start:614 stop:2887 length:2274 start_codon:yes stop_codon:yes gene_type:complete